VNQQDAQRFRHADQKAERNSPVSGDNLFVRHINPGALYIHSAINRNLKTYFAFATPQLVLTPDDDGPIANPSGSVLSGVREGTLEEAESGRFEMTDKEGKCCNFAGVL